MSKKPETEITKAEVVKARVNLLFKQPVGKSVPGGPYFPEILYSDLGPEVYENELVKGMIQQGLIQVLSDINPEAQSINSTALAEAVARIQGSVAEAEGWATEAEMWATKSKEAFEALNAAGEDVISAEEALVAANYAKDQATKAAGEARAVAEKEASTPKG